MSFDEAISILGKDEAFRATVYAMNTLLLRKGIYSAEEFEILFCQHAQNYLNGFQGRNQAASPVSSGVALTTP